jgi:hypothetical protein
MKSPARKGRVGVNANQITLARRRRAYSAALPSQSELLVLTGGMEHRA